MWKWLALAALVSAQAEVPYGLSPGSDADRRPRPGPAPRPPAAPDAGEAVSCATPVQPDRSCAADTDCVALTRTVSCCGTQAITGVRREHAWRVQAWDRQCNRGRACGCAPGPTLLDDGTRLDRRAPVAASCRANVCTTHALPRPAGFTSETVKALPRCAREECPRAPMLPTQTCADGVSQSGRGPCVRLDGACRWVRLECPR